MKYPWAKWGNGKAWRAEQGKDFTSSVSGFRQTLYSHARKNGWVVRSHVPQQGVIEFRFVKGA